MVFSSLIFLYFFLPLCLLLYFCTNYRPFQNIVLVIASLIFYAWGEPLYVGLLIFSSVFDYVNSLIIEKNRGTPLARTMLIVSVAGNLAILGLFKYSDFLITQVNMLLSTSIPLTELPLPIGISFYTFQTMSYTIDVYRNDVKAQRYFIKYMMYVCMFPQLVAGPIVRYRDIAREIDDRNISVKNASEGATRFVIGLAKKVLLANPCGAVVTAIFVSGGIQPSILGHWFGILMFAFQIYFDFSGYSDMAIGLGRIFGFTYLENFNYPYISRSVTEFWRRWHMSLGSFFRDYVYIPLGGNRKNQYFNIAIVWFLTGLWHGASWNFILWGMFYGALLAIEKLFLKKILDSQRILGVLYMIFITLIGWTIFYFVDARELVNAFAVMFGVVETSWTNVFIDTLFAENLAVIVCCIIASCPVIPHLRTALQKYQNAPTYFATVAGALLLALSTISLVGQTFNPFLYFRF